MSVIIGQDKIISEIDRYSIDTFPKTIMFSGAFGSGKHLLCDYVADKLHLDIFDITDSINIDSINEICLMTTPRLYIINVSRITVKEQNILLKFIEEPPVNVFIALITDRLNIVIDTVKNRARIFQLEVYSKEELKKFAMSNGVLDDRVIEISQTPGEVLFFKDFAYQLDDIKNYCKKIFDNIQFACVSNALRISSKLSYKEKDNLFNQRCFFRILKSVAFDFVIKNADPKYYQAYVLTEKLNENFEVPHVNVQYILENYLIALKEVMSK